MIQTTLHTPKNQLANYAPATALSRGVSVIVPTFREAPNIPILVNRLAAVRESRRLDLDVWFMDDGSGDGSREAVESLALPWVRLVERDGPRGLSPAVLEGMRSSAGETLVVMDADLSHPPETIPDLLMALNAGADMAFGSRHVAGGSMQEGWGLHRKVNSVVATLLARPLTRLRDPMSGFFALRRSLLDGSAKLDPIGYKIGLELVVKSGAGRVVEVPIRFTNRHAGSSKLTPVQQLKYVEHLRRLYFFRFGFRFGGGVARAPAKPVVVVAPKFHKAEGPSDTSPTSAAKTR